MTLLKGFSRTFSFVSAWLEWTFSKERVIANPNTKSAKKIEEQKQKRLSSQKRGKKEKRQDRRDAKGE
jgi:hypothetical protein